MGKYREYCELLGVAPGADAKKVQESFRSRIKKCHPDASGTASDKKRAQLLIEAYSALKRGVPLRGGGGEEGQNSENAAAAFWKREDYGRKASTATRENAYFAGKRMFKNIFDKKSSNAYTYTHSFFNDLGVDVGMEEAVYPADEETEMWEYTPLKKKTPPSSEEPEEWGGDEYSAQQYARAEMSLRQIVSSFESQGNRFQRRWAREYIGDLAQVQVLYRDLCRLRPHLSYKALQRIRQISELITEIRKAL